MAPEKKYKLSQIALDSERAAMAKEKEPENAVPRVVVQAARNTTFMDPELWGQMQYLGDGVLLENVYSRLPLEEFYELRVVCKTWHAMARERMALNEKIHKPFFNLCTRGNRFPTRLCGMLTFNKLILPPSSASTSEPSSGSKPPAPERKPAWTWTRRGNRPLGYYVSSSYQSFAYEGLVCSHDIGRYGRRLFSESAVDVLDWNIDEFQPGPMRTSRRTRPVAEVPHNGAEPMVMGVTVLPKKPHEWLQRFMLVLGSLEYGTQVFTSDLSWGTWETKPCRPVVRGAFHGQTTGCASCHGRVYITMEFSREILVYDFEHEVWSSIDAPGGSALSPVSMLPQHYRNDTLGAWNGHIYDVVDDPASMSLSLWELDEAKPGWTVFERMPTDLYRGWLKSEGHGASDIADLTIHASFSGDFALVYSWVFQFERAHRFCLFNMATKLWQRLPVDGNMVFIKRSGTVEWYGW